MARFQSLAAAPDSDDEDDAGSEATNPQHKDDAGSEATNPQQDDLSSEISPLEEEPEAPMAPPPGALQTSSNGLAASTLEHNSTWQHHQPELVGSGINAQLAQQKTEEWSQPPAGQWGAPQAKTPPPPRPPPRDPRDQLDRSKAHWDAP